jgi:ribosomal protein S19E (S16A)
MSTPAATIRRTSVVASPKVVISWAGAYANEVRKHKSQEPEDGIAVGKTYFTSRPMGELSIHGYGRQRVRQLKRTTDPSGNDAVLEYLREHCRHQQVKGRKTMGIRLVMSMDPARVTRLLQDLVDVDQLLVRAAETTFSELANRHYPGDELCFVMGIHHDVHTNAKAPERGRLPHIHGHVLLLPQTKKGLRISLSNHTAPGRNGIYVDMLDETVHIYRESVEKHVYNYSIKQSPRLEAVWEPLVREGCVSTIEDFRNAPRMTDWQAKRRFGVTRFVYHLGAMDREQLRRRYAKRRQQFAESSNSNRDATSNLIIERFHKLKEVLALNMDARGEHVESLRNAYRNAPADMGKITSWDVPSGRALLVKTTPGRLIVPGNRKAEIRKALEELDDIRKASLIQSVAEVTELELKLGALQYEEPMWIGDLAQVAQMEELPHQTIINAAPPADPLKPSGTPETPAPTEQPAPPPPRRIPPSESPEDQPPQPGMGMH